MAPISPVTIQNVFVRCTVVVTQKPTCIRSAASAAFGNEMPDLIPGVALRYFRALTKMAACMAMTLIQHRTPKAPNSAAIPI